MTELFKEQQVIKVVPEDVEQACSMTVVSVDESSVVMSAAHNASPSEGEAEFFAVVDGGIIYFAANLEKNDSGQYKVMLPPSNKILQRREYSRVKFSSNIALNSADSQIDVETTDISAGGMQIVSKKELAMSDDYDFSLELDKNVSIVAKFTPIRQDKLADGSYIVSGKFNELANKGRMSLVQFCFKKQMENTNK